MIIAAGALLLGLGVLLWQMTRETDEVAAAGAPPAKHAPPAPPPPAQESATPVRSAKIATPPQQTVSARTPQRAPQGDTPALAPDPAKADPDPPARKELKYQLKKQIDAIDGYVSDCVTKAAKAGSKPKGAANLLLKAARVKGKTVILETSVEPLDTTIKDPADQPLLDCLAATSRKMQLDLPEDAVTILATHQVDLDGGAVVDHKLTALYVNPQDVPPPAP